MAIFRKNKRQFGHRSHRNLFVALFLLLVFGVSGIVTFVLNANAQLVPVASVEITSEHTNYENNESGAWKVTKSAEWTALGKARITFDVESIAKYDNSKKFDVVMVIDNSGSMSGEKMAQVKTDASELTEALLVDTDNKIALITFNTGAETLSGFSNNKQQLIDQINSIETPGCTNYYAGLLEAEKVLEGYEKNDERELILLFLTDGYPNEQTPNEVAQYHLLKKNYPYMTINGIQYEMGDTVLQPIIDVSDNQFIANINTLNNVLFEATIVPYMYDDFVITDYVNDDYWTVAGLEALEASLGEVGLEYDGSTPKITWDMSGVFRSGKTATLTIDVDLKPEFIDIDGLLLPTNKHEEIETTIDGEPDENEDKTDTPILKDSYDVIYDANAPLGCEYPGEVPERTTHSIFTTVEVSDNQLSCDGYKFRGWRVASEDVSFVNDDYFIMPAQDVLFRGVWTKFGIEKSMDGTVHVRASATFMGGMSLNIRMKTLSGQVNPSYSTRNSDIKAFVRADELPESLDTTNSLYDVSDASSNLPIYAWFDDGTIYYYTDADDVYLNRSAGHMFYLMSGLENIEGLSIVNTSRVTGMNDVFYQARALKNIDAIANWDVSNVNDMKYMFGGTAIENLDALANWETDSLRNVAHMFISQSTLKDIDGLSNWNMSNVTTMEHMFLYSYALEDISALENWDVGNVKNMSSMFTQTLISDISPLTNWDTSNVTDMSSMFYAMSKLTNISPLANWNTSNVTDMSYMFGGDPISDVDALATKTVEGVVRWDTSNVTDMSDMFVQANITNINGLSDWNTSNVTDMSGMFSNAKLTNISGAANWNTSNVKDMSYMFSKNVDLANISALANWDTGNVTNMTYLFKEDSIEDISSLANWNTSKVTNMSYMFYKNKITNVDALATKTVDGVVRWNTGNVTNMSNMFYSMRTLTNIDGVIGWNTANVTDMSYMFSYSGLTDIDGVENWNTGNVTNMYWMFYGSESLADISGVTNWNTANVTKMTGLFRSAPITDLSSVSNWSLASATDISNMFAGSKTTNLNAFTNWNTANVTNMSGIFAVSYELEDISGIANWNTSNVTDMSNLLSNTSITNIDALATKTVDGVVRWDTSNVTKMRYMFYHTNLSDVSGASNWNTSNVTDMNRMFGESNITNIDALATKTVDGVVRWDMSNMKDMAGMFYYAASLENVNGAADWNTSSVTDMSSLFHNAASLNNIDGVSNWNTSSVTNMSNLFTGVSHLTSLGNPDSEDPSKRGVGGWNTNSLTSMSSAFSYMTNLENVEALRSWNTGGVQSFYNLFYADRNIQDLSPIEDWNVSNVTNMGYMFYNVPEAAGRPSWFH